MTTGSDRPYVDPQHMTGADTQIYEAIATLEQAGNPVTAGAVAAATGLDAAAATARLDALAGSGVLIRDESAGEPAFSLARRDWSATPHRAAP